MNDKQHIPVLVDEIMEIFQPEATDVLLDATLGLGGHTAAYLRAGGRVVGIDADPKAIQLAQGNLAEFGERVTYIEGNFTNLKELTNNFRKKEQQKELKNSLPGGGIVETNIPSEFSHILFDLGFNSSQITDTDSGISFSSQTSLNMRYGSVGSLPQSSVKSINSLTQRLGSYPDVPELIEHLRAEEIEEVIRLYGEERHARRIAEVIKGKLPKTSQELSNVVSEAVSKGYEHGRINPATRTFQAFRIAVNREMEVLAAALPRATELLRDNGKLAVISFHSLEDRIVKNFIRNSNLVPVNKKPIVASDIEIKKNPRSRSAN